MQKEPWIVEILRFVVPFLCAVSAARDQKIWYRVSVLRELAYLTKSVAGAISERILKEGDTMGHTDDARADMPLYW